jgi:PAS domain S-box-containing protein
MALLVSSQGSSINSHLVAPIPGAVPARPPAWRVLVLGLATTAAYVIAADLGFRLAFIAEQITTVWAPTGIALAALLWGGLRLWPAIWIGALIANVGTDAPAWTAPLIASGNTLEAVAAVWLLRVRGASFDVGFGRVTDVVRFVVVAGGLCTTISATVGVVTLCAGAVQPWSRFGILWFDWWFGDALGAILVAPALLTTIGKNWSRDEALRAGGFALVAIGVAYAIFAQLLGPGVHPIEFAMFPVVIAAAVVGGPRITTLVVLAASAVAIGPTVRGLGPFASPDAHHSLVLLQVFMGVLGITALLLAAAVAERQTAERQARDAAKVLNDSEEMLRLAQRAGGVAAFEWDFRNQVARCSAEFFRIFGFPAQDGTMTGQQWGQFVHPEDRDRMGAHLARALEGTEAAAADYRIVRPDGDVRWLSYAGQVQRTPAGERMLGTVVDITDRKRLEAELRHHVAEVERILESIGEGFVALDLEYRYVYVNGAAEQMLGRTRAELMGRVPWEVFPIEAIGDWKRQFEAAMSSGTPTSYEAPVPAWNRWYETRMYPSGGGLSIFFTDITGRREAETALRESHDVLSLAMGAGSMGAWARNLSTNEVWWSRELEELFALSPGAFARTEAGFLEFVHEEDRPMVRRAVDDAVASRSDYVVEFRFRRAREDGWRWMEGRGRAVYAEDGTPRSLYGIGIDVTARKRTELALREAKNAAEQTQIQLEEASRLKDEFLATLSHELRTPLNAVLGWARMLRHDAMQPSTRQRALEAIERNATAQAQLVDDLLDVSRIVAGKLPMRADAVDLGTVIANAVDTVHAGASAKGLQLVTHVPADYRIIVTGDADRLQQVVWNLVSNAIKFTHPGGRVDVELRELDSSAEIRVRDTGQGIEPSFRPHLFQRFRQMDGSKARLHGGLGLGLSIVRHLVEGHGGSVSAHSDGPGHGATFSVVLPLRAVEGVPVEATPMPSAPDAPNTLSGVHVAVAGEDAGVRGLLQGTLEHAGATVVTAASAGEALHLLTDRRFDTLLVDLDMPEEDSRALIRFLRGLPTGSLNRDIPAIAVTAHASWGQEETLASGFSSHLGKPVDSKLLVAMIADLLGSEAAQ